MIIFAVILHMKILDRLSRWCQSDIDWATFRSAFPQNITHASCKHYIFRYKLAQIRDNSIRAILNETPQTSGILCVYIAAANVRVWPVAQSIWHPRWHYGVSCE